MQVLQTEVLNKLNLCSDYVTRGAHPEENMKISASFDEINPIVVETFHSKSVLCQHRGGAKGKVRGRSKSLGFII